MPFSFHMTGNVIKYLVVGVQ